MGIFVRIFRRRNRKNAEKAETCQCKPLGKQMEFKLLFVTCRKDTAIATHRITPEKNFDVKARRKAKGKTEERITWRGLLQMLKRKKAERSGINWRPRTGLLLLFTFNARRHFQKYLTKRETNQAS